MPLNPNEKLTCLLRGVCWRISSADFFLFHNHKSKMDLTKKIFAALKPKVGAFGFNRKELMGVAAGIADNLELADDASEEDIDAAVDKAVEAAIPMLKVGQAMATRVINNTKANGKADEEIDDEEIDDPKSSKKSSKSTKANEGNDVPAWVEDLKKNFESLANQVTALQGEKLSATRRGKLMELLKDTGTFGARTLKSFDKMSFADDDEFEEFFAEVEDDLKALNQERADAGLSHLGTPPAVPPATPPGQNKELVTDAELEAMVKSY